MQNKVSERLPVGLCCGSLVQADFRQLAEAAGQAGFNSISLWPTLYRDALAAGLSPQDMRLILEDNGLHISELDPLSSWLPTDLDPNELAAVFHTFTEDDFYRIADELGGRTLNLIQLGIAKTAEAERLDLIRGVCERAASHNLRVSFEFLPWTVVKNLRQALELLTAVAHPNLGVNIDTWHHFRSGGTVQQLTAVDPGQVAAMQFNDVAAEPWEDVLEETVAGRLVPGEGASDAVSVYHALSRLMASAPCNIEVFSAELMALPAKEAAQRLASGTYSVIEQARALTSDR